jgi:hypothetical protein
MTDNFIDSTYLIEDYNRVIGSPKYQNFTSTNTTSHPHLKTSPQSNIYMSGVRGEFNQYQRTPLTDDAHPYKDEMSQDQIYDLFLGLALVKKCVDSSANFNGLPMADGSVSLLQEAINITNRIINRVVEDNFILKNQSDRYNGECTVTPNECGTDFTEWGCEHNCVIGDASNLHLLAYGAVKAASFITGRSVVDIYGIRAPLIPMHQAIWNLIGSAEAIALYDLISIVNDDAKHEYKFMTALAAVGGEWENANLYSTISADEFLSDIYYNPDLASDPDNYFLNAFGAFQFGFSINMVEPRMRFFTHNFAFNEIEYLIYCFLHDDSPNWTGANTIDFEALMDDAPCEGPYFYASPLHINGNIIPSFQTFNWSTPSRWKNGYDLTNHSPSDQNNGEYSGLDYMLLFNMYCLLNPSYVNYSFDSNNETISSTQNYPYSLSMPFLTQPPVSVRASNSNPATLFAFETISSAGSVNFHNSNLYADLTYKAGKQIHLSLGFKVQKGARFHAIIEPITCDNNGNYRAANNKLIWENSGNENPTPLSTRITNNSPKVEKNKRNIPLSPHKKAVSKLFEISVFPNPSEGIINVSITEGAMIKQIILTDILGHKVAEKSTSENQVILDYNNIGKGSYILEITDHLNNVFHKKVILE